MVERDRSYRASLEELAADLDAVLAAGPAEQRRVTPVWHLNFVGFILAGITAPAVGMAGLGIAILWATGAMAVAIWAESARQFLAAGVPAPLRPPCCA